ncbi:alpha/beta fold hydrolase [Saccharospirillum sp.]|uniref:alpha/beta fold hydrolase n=1 Tax=Saccharospirillum sp. TaxID=2033801 RepID=UPI0034A05F55
MTEAANSNGGVSGRLIVLIPSLARDNSDFDVLAELLQKQGYQVLCPQPYGLDFTDTQTDNETLFDLAGDVALLIEQQQLGPALVAGHAFGNWVARALATRYPGCVSGIALLAAAPKGPIDPELRNGINCCLDDRRSEAERLEALSKVYFAPGNDPSVWLYGWHPELARRQRLTASNTVEEWWCAGVAPILDVQARGDVFLPSVPHLGLQRELGDRVAVHVIEDAGHALIPEQPQAVADALTAFAETAMACSGSRDRYQ